MTKRKSLRKSIKDDKKDKYKGATRESIFNASLDIKQDYVPPVFPKSKPDVKFIEECISGELIAEIMSADEQKTFINAMEKEHIKAGVTVINQGDIADYFYVIDKGEVKIIIDGKEVGNCKRGDSFGDLALLYKFRRTATCLTTTDVTIWKVHQRTFRSMMATGAKKKEDNILNILRKVPFLKDLDDGQLTTISEALVPLNIEAGKRLFSKEDVGNIFFIVEKGNLKAHNIGKGLSKFMELKLKPGEFFGERSVMTGEPRIADVTAVTDCVLLCLTKEIFSSVLGDYKKILFEETKKKLLMSIPIFSSSKVTPRDISKLVKLFEAETYEKDTYLAKEGEPISNPGIYYIKEGHVRVSTRDGIIMEFRRGEHFGGRTIQASESEDKKFDVTARIMEKTTFYVLTKKQIESVVGSVSALGNAQEYSKELRHITPGDLMITRVLGQGSFGKVFLVYHEATGEHYAMKTISKAKLVALKCSQAVLRERNIMASSYHPFVIKIISTFQDDKKLYMILELIQGGELFKVIYDDDESPGVSHEEAQFYGACVHEGLAHIHAQDIAFRDLKPENILVDKLGYCILIDFGFAKVVVDKTFTMCGTPEYVAPEIILSRGHNTAADNWALGILIYELMAGKTPFHESGISERKMFRHIMKGKFDFPDNGVFSDASKDIITKLLNTNPQHRLGSCAGGEFKISGHDFFKEIEWKKLLEKKIEAPWLPEVDDTDDESEEVPLTNVVEDDDDEDDEIGLTTSDNDSFRNFGMTIGKVATFRSSRTMDNNLIKEDIDEDEEIVENIDLVEHSSASNKSSGNVENLPSKVNASPLKTDTNRTHSSTVEGLPDDKETDSKERESFDSTANTKSNPTSDKKETVPGVEKLSSGEDKPIPTSRISAESFIKQNCGDYYDSESEGSRKISSSMLGKIFKKLARCTCIN